MLNPRLKHLLRSRFFIGVLLWFQLQPLYAQAPPAREHQVKAVFLFNFTQFISWPAKAFTDDQTPLVIGVLGKNPFGNYLKQTVANEKVDKHPLTIKYYNSVEEIRDCHVLFINLSEDENLEEVLSSLKGKSILTVGDAGNFLKRGGMIRFMMRDDKIQLQINPDAVKAADLTVSSQLLRLAEIVIPKKSN